MTANNTLTRKKPMKPGTTPMKRTEFKRSTKQIGHKTALKHGTTRLRTYGKRKASSGDIYRSEAYLAVVRTLNCVCCRRSGCTEPAHSNQLRFGKGRGIKASDATAMALCGLWTNGPGCHAIHDQGGKLAKAEWYAFEYKHIFLTVLALVEANKLTGAPEVLAVVKVIGEDYEAAAVFFIYLIETGQLKVIKQ